MSTGSVEDQSSPQASTPHDLRTAMQDGRQRSAASPSCTFPGPPNECAPLGQVGDFDVLTHLSTDCFGSTFRARERVLNRIVSLKVLNPETASRPELLERIRRDSRTASVRHEHVVAVYRFENPVGFYPYLVMEHVEGESLQEKMRREHQLPPLAAASIARQIALGLATLQECGVIHRSVLPTSILLDSLTGRAKVRDFGFQCQLSDAVCADNPAGGAESAPYLSPEHFRVPNAVDGRSDVFSLGVILYQMLMGTLPFMGAPQQTRAAEPIKPRRLNPAIAADLETIVLACLEKAPERRYPTARAVAEDLQRYLNGAPILRPAAGPIQRTIRWVRRQPATAGLCGLMGVGMAALVALFVGQWFNTHIQHVEAELATAQDFLQEKEASLRRVHYLADMSLAYQAWQNDKPQTLSRLLATQSDPKLQGFEWHYLRWLASRDGRRFGPKDPVTAATFDATGQLLALGVLLGKDKTAQVQIWKTPTPEKPLGELIYTLDGHPYPITAILFHPKKDLLVAADEGDQIRIWDHKNGKKIRTLEGSMPMTISASGQVLAFTRDDGRIQRWSLVNEREIGGPIGPLDASIASEPAKGPGVPGKVGDKSKTKMPFPGMSKGFPKSKPGESTQARPKTGASSKDSYEGEAGFFEHLAFSPDGQRFVAAGGQARQSGFALLWDLKDGKARKLEDAAPADLITSIAFSPDGQTIAAAGFDHTLRVWDAATGRLRFRRTAHQLELLTVAFNSTGTHIATAGVDRIIRIWNARSGEEVRSFRGAQGIVREVLFCPKSNQAGHDSLLSLNEQGELRWWNADEGQAAVVFRHASPVVSLAISSDGKFLASVTQDSRVLVQDLDSKDRRHELGANSNVVRGIFNEGGKSLLTLGSDGIAKIWHFEKSKTLVYQPKGDAPQENIWLADHRVIVRRDQKFWISRLHPSVDQSLEDLDSFGKATTWDPSAVAVDRAGVRFALALNTNLIVLRQRTPESAVIVEKPMLAPGTKNAGHAAVKVNALAFSHDGRFLAAACHDSSILLWDTQTGVLKHHLSGHLGSVTCVVFSPDGKRLVSGSEDWTVKVWDIEFGRPILTLTDHKGRIRDLAFRPNGTYLATASEDGTVRLWPGAYEYAHQLTPRTSSAIADSPRAKRQE